jgi:hypothetical protein
VLGRLSPPFLHCVLSLTFHCHLQGVVVGDLCASQSYPEGKMSKHIGSLKVGDELEVSWKVGAGYGRAAIVKYSRNLIGSGTDALAVWLDSTPCPAEKEGSQRVIGKK